jgi:hypothetical protein
LWVEINENTPKERSSGTRRPTVWDIEEKPAETFEVRICVLNCVDIPIMDAEGTTDAFCRGFFDPNDDS